MYSFREQFQKMNCSKKEKKRERKDTQRQAPKSGSVPRGSSRNTHSWALVHANDGHIVDTRHHAFRTPDRIKASRTSCLPTSRAFAPFLLAHSHRSLPWIYESTPHRFFCGREATKP